MNDYLSSNRDYSSSCTSSSTVFPASIQESHVFSDEYIIDDNVYKCYDQQQNQAQTLVCINEQYECENNVDDFFNLNHYYQNNSQQNIQFVNEVNNQDNDQQIDSYIQNYQIQPIQSNYNHNQQQQQHINQKNKQHINQNYHYSQQKTQNYDYQLQQNQSYNQKQQPIQNYINQQQMNQNYSQQNFYYQQKQSNFIYQQQFQHNQYEPLHDQYQNPICEYNEQKMTKIVISNQQVENPVQNQYNPNQYFLHQNQQNQQQQHYQQQPYQNLQQQQQNYSKQTLVELSAAVGKQDNQFKKNQNAQSTSQIKQIYNNVGENYENSQKDTLEQNKVQCIPITYIQEDKLKQSSSCDDKSDLNNDKSDSSNQESQTQDSQIKQNIYKSIMNAFKQFLVQKQKIYSLFSNNDKIDNKLKQLARFLKTHSFNHQVLKYIALHETYSIIFSHFINNECELWLSKSKIVKKEIAVSILSYLKQCVLDKNQFDDFICYKTSKKSKKEKDLNLELD